MDPRPLARPPIRLGAAPCRRVRHIAHVEGSGPMSGRGRVCMYVPYLYPVVSGGKVPFAGGIEVQLSLLAKGLVARGFDVSVVTCDYGQADDLVVDGVRLMKCFGPEEGLPVLR